VLVDLGAAAPRFVPLPIPTYEKIAVRLTEDMGGVAAEGGGPRRPPRRCPGKTCTV
jgi:hypothetical protein